jgi:hypothetical protein
LRQWIADGRANAQTKVFAEGGVEWVPLGSLPEFAVPGAGPAFPPDFMSTGDADAVRERALRAVNPPGIAMIILGVLGMLLSLGMLVFYAVMGVPENSLFPSSQPTPAYEVGRKAGAMGGVVFSLCWSAFVAFAAHKMRRLESWGLALTGAIMALIPCCGGQVLMCFLGLPVGIWALVVICRADVKSQFS